MLEMKRLDEYMPLKLIPYGHWFLYEGHALIKFGKEGSWSLNEECHYHLDDDTLVQPIVLRKCEYIQGLEL